MICTDGPTDYVALLTDEAIAYAHQLMSDTVHLSHDIRRNNLVTVTSLLEVIKDRHSTQAITHHSTRTVAPHDGSIGVMKTPALDPQPHEENGKKEMIE